MSDRVVPTRPRSLSARTLDSLALTDREVGLQLDDGVTYVELVAVVDARVSRARPLPRCREAAPPCHANYWPTRPDEPPRQVDHDVPTGPVVRTSRAYALPGITATDPADGPLSPPKTSAPASFSQYRGRLASQRIRISNLGSNLIMELAGLDALHRPPRRAFVTAGQAAPTRGPQVSTRSR